MFWRRWHLEQKVSKEKREKEMNSHHHVQYPSPSHYGHSHSHSSNGIQQNGAGMSHYERLNEAGRQATRDLEAFLSNTLQAAQVRSFWLSFFILDLVNSLCFVTASDYTESTDLSSSSSITLFSTSTKLNQCFSFSSSRSIPISRSTTTSTAYHCTPTSSTSPATLRPFT